MNGVYTTGQVAEKLKVNTETIRRLLRAKKLLGFKVGQDWRITEQDLMSFITGQAGAGQDTTSQLIG